MRKLANMLYDEKIDKLFFTYLDRTLNVKQIMEVEIVGTGPKLLKDFVTDLGSLTVD